MDYKQGEKLLIKYYNPANGDMSTDVGRFVLQFGYKGEIYFILDMEEKDRPMFEIVKPEDVELLETRKEKIAVYEKTMRRLKTIGVDVSNQPDVVYTLAEEIERYRKKIRVLLDKLYD